MAAEKGSSEDVLIPKPMKMLPYKAKGTRDVIKIKDHAMDRLSWITHVSSGSLEDPLQREE